MDLRFAEAEIAAPAHGAEPGTLVEQPAGHKAPFPPFDPTHFASQLLWFAITFVALYFLLAKVAMPRIAGILATRRGRITGDLAEAEQAKLASEAAGAAYEKALAEARARAFGIAEKARDASKAAADAERAKNEADLARRLATAEARIAEIKERALAEVGAIAAEATAAVVSALSGAEPSAKEVDEAVGAAMAGRSADGV